MNEQPRKYDTIVVGGGHAGAEAAHVCARGGLNTLLITMNLDTIGQMSCNPAIGGIAKGHMVRELDAMGGLMGRIADRTGIHFKMLNHSRGPAVWAPRCQSEKRAYQNEVKWALEETANLSFYQDTCEKLIIEDDSIRGIVTGRGKSFECDAVILTTGTFLRGLIHIGEFQQRSGRIAEASAMGLSECLLSYGFQLGRLKTGTPPRVHRRTLDLGVMEEQVPDDPPQAFSFQTRSLAQQQTSCWITYTNERSHEIIRANLDRSPMYSGQIESTGPRYCPSIEDKVVRFAERQRHHVFVEPEGMHTGEVYLNGVSTSLPEEVQWQVVRSCRGMEEAEIIRPGYAVEYDYVDPRELTPDLQTRKIKSLYFAGQINGTTGYEEAAAQGFMAGLNVLRKARGENPFVLSRGEAYIGVLVDDLVHKGVEDPYRMFTSRAEHRLLLRQDNADQRLMKYGYDLGLIDKDVYGTMQEKYRRVHAVRASLESTGLKPSAELDHLVERKKIPAPSFGKSLAAFLRRPEIRIDDLTGIHQDLQLLTDEQRAVVEMEIKYQGYVDRQNEQIEAREKWRSVRIPSDFDYATVRGLKREAIEKLKRSAPATLDAAMRISGVDSTDIDLIYLHLKEAAVV